MRLYLLPPHFIDVSNVPKIILSENKGKSFLLLIARKLTSDTDVPTDLISFI